MKLKMLLVSVVVVAAFAAADARADCSLTVSPSSSIARGEFFSFIVGISDFSPLDPFAAFRIVFYGAKNGVADIPPTGEPYPGTFGYGNNNLTGFQNTPSGAFVGEYIRWAFIYDRNGNLFCVTNAVNVSLK
jgi:hypothetical protein